MPCIRLRLSSTSLNWLGVVLSGCQCEVYESSEIKVDARRHRFTFILETKQLTQRQIDNEIIAELQPQKVLFVFFFTVSGCFIKYLEKMLYIVFKLFATIK